jgi:hypothetical protein
MRYFLKIVVPSVPPYNHDAYGFADMLVRASQGMPPAPRLIQFYDAITERFPCASSGAYADDDLDGIVCPWGEAPLIDCFTGDVGVLSIVARNVEVIPFLLRRAGALALTVIDEQAGKVHRPATFSVTVGNIQPHVDRAVMLGRLAALLKRAPEEIAELLDTPHAPLKRRLDHVTAQRLAKTLDLIGCDCNVEKELPELGLSVAISGPGAVTPPPVISWAERDEYDSAMPETPPPPLLIAFLSRLWHMLTHRPQY